MKFTKLPGKPRTHTCHDWSCNTIKIVLRNTCTYYTECTKIQLEVVSQRHYLGETDVVYPDVIQQAQCGVSTIRFNIDWILI